jgi:ATP-dependent RNA helicase DDX18/HAS1
VVEELIDCSGGDDISLETGTARKLEALAKAIDRHRCGWNVNVCVEPQQ